MIGAVAGLLVACSASDEVFVEVPAGVDRVAVFELVRGATFLGEGTIVTASVLRPVDEAIFVEDPEGAVVVVGYGDAQLADYAASSLGATVRWADEGDVVALPEPAWSVRVDGAEQRFDAELPPLFLPAPERRAGGWAYVANQYGSVGPRFRYGMTYDPVRDRVVLFGGDNNNTTTRLSDTWIFTDRWRAVTATTGPSERSLGQLAYDPAGGRVLLYGGFGATSGSLADTWAFDDGWTRLEQNSAPGRRSGHRMVLDERTGQVVLFGGVSQEVTTAETWVFDTDGWRALQTPRAPPGRRDFGMIYHPERSSILIVGGADEYQARVFEDAWELTESGWRRAEAFDLDFGRRSFALAWDPERAQLVLHGGWDGTTSFDDTLLHDGTTWRTARFEQELSQRRRHRAVYVPRIGAVLTVAGESGFTTTPNDVHEFRPQSL